MVQSNKETETSLSRQVLKEFAIVLAAITSKDSCGITHRDINREIGRGQLKLTNAILRILEEDEQIKQIISESTGERWYFGSNCCPFD
jgi:hypothetical protein